MLVLSRHKNEDIMIGDVVVRVVDIRGDKVRLGIDAPKNVKVHRREVYEAIQRERKRKSQIATHEAGQDAGNDSNFDDSCASKRVATDGLSFYSTEVSQ